MKNDQTGDRIGRSISLAVSSIFVVIIAVLASTLAAGAGLIVIAVVTFVANLARGEDMPRYGDHLFVALSPIIALVALATFVLVCTHFVREARDERTNQRQNREYDVKRAMEEIARHEQYRAEWELEPADGFDFRKLFDELDELRWLERRVSIFGWVIIGGYAIIILGGGALSTWAARTIGYGLGAIASIATFALFMAWPNAFQWQIEALFFGPRNRVNGAQIKARIREIEIELEARRRMNE